MTTHRRRTHIGKRRTSPRLSPIELLEPRTLLAYVPAAAAGVVNTYLTGFQGGPSVATAPDQRFMVAWEDNALDGSGVGIYARRFLATGEPDGNSFRVNTATFGDQRWPYVAFNDSGASIVAWGSSSDGTTQFQRFASDGTKQGGNVVVPNAPVTAPGVIMEPDGSFFVYWLDQSQGEFKVQRYDSAGELSDIFQAPAADSGWLQAILPGRAVRFGNELLFPFHQWKSEVITDVGERYRGLGVIRRVALDGSGYVDEVLVDYTGPKEDWLWVIHPNLLPLQDGTLLATWTAGGSSAVTAKRFDSKFQPIGDAFSLSGIESATNNAFVRTAQLASGDIVATWSYAMPFEDDVSYFGVYGVDGTPRGEPALIAAANAPYLSSLEVIPHGDAFTLVWQGLQDRYASESDVNIQHFKSIVAAVEVGIEPASTQADENEFAFQYDVVRTGTIDVPTRVYVKTADDSARANVDYTPIDEELVFQPGESRKSLMGFLIDNEDLDGSRAFRVRISSVSGEGASIANNHEILVNIADDETPGGGGGSAGVISIFQTGYVVLESVEYVPIILSRDEDGQGEVSVRVTTENGSALSGGDYTGVSEVVTWFDGDMQPKTVYVPIRDDTVNEPTETFRVSIGDPKGGASLGAISAATVTINDDDPPPPPLVRLASIAPKFRRGVLNSVAISFNGTPDPSQRMKPNAIVLVRAGRDRKIGTADDLVTRFRGVRVSSAIHGVILTPPPGLTLKGNYHVRVDGALIKDLNGSRLDADNDGIPGGRRYVKVTKRAWIETV